MNDSRKLRKSSDEVRIEMKNSDPPRKQYWNLRDKEYHYLDDPQKTSGETVINQNNNFESRRQRDNGNRNNQSGSSRNQIRVSFNLDETRQISQSQKQTILNTLTEGEVPVSKDATQSVRYRNLIPENGLIPLMALLAFFALFALILVAATSGYPHYYY
jgi:hypothetical protein